VTCWRHGGTRGDGAIAAGHSWMVHGSGTNRVAARSAGAWVCGGASTIAARFWVPRATRGGEFISSPYLSIFLGSSLRMALRTRRATLSALRVSDSGIGS